MKFSFICCKIFYVRSILQNERICCTCVVKICPRDVHFKVRDLDFSLRQLLNDWNAAKLCNHTLQEFSFILEEFLAYLLTYIAGQLLRSESPLSEQHLYNLGQLVAELRISLKVRTFCKMITIQRILYSGSD